MKVKIDQNGEYKTGMVNSNEKVNPEKWRNGLGFKGGEVTVD
jgi:hypothetical protein